MIRRLILVAAFAAVALAGCQHKCSLNEPCCRPKPFQPPPPSGPMLLPPAGVPTAPIGPGPAPTTAPAFIPQVGPNDTRNYPPPSLEPLPASPSLKPAPEVLLPDPLPGGSSSRNPTPGKSALAYNQNPQMPATPEPPVAATTRAGLPGFTVVGEGLATGRKPELDGFESLKRSGYRTIVNLYSPGENIAAVRELATKNGLEFVPIETTPENLASALDAFNGAVGDKSIRPIYVFSSDPIRTGSLWYLHFRSIDALNDDAARLRAKPLGLSDQGPEAKAFELAIQKYLSGR